VPVPFNPSPEFSVGMEMELQLIDPATFDLADAVVPLLQRHREEEHVKPEIFQASVEVASPPERSVADLAVSMRTLLHDLHSSAESLGVAICSAGTHPFYRRSAAITPGARYRNQEESAGWLSHHQVTFATHVHLGVESGDEAVTLMAELKPYLPVLIALSANSPFWQGEDTRFAAFRSRALASARTYGAAPDFADWAAFERFMDCLRRVRVAQAVRDLHWDIRPSPGFGTVEVRIMDAQPTLRDALALAALLRALVRFLQHSRGAPSLRPLASLHWWLQRDNCYVASRYGIDAKLAATEARTTTLRTLALAVLRAVTPFADADEAAYLDRLRQTLEQGGLPYLRQRRTFATTSSLRAVVRALIVELRDEIG
jgi:glutamate---cysteine ligase / carboxylate-amine ligase